MTAADRFRTIREHIAAERTKLPAVDHNGHPIAAPVEPAPTPEPEPTGPRTPAPDPSQGARGGAPLDTAEEKEIEKTAKQYVATNPQVWNLEQAKDYVRHNRAKNAAMYGRLNRTLPPAA